MRIFNAEGERRYQEWVLKFCAKATKGQGEVPYALLESDETSVLLFGTGTPDRNHWNGPCPNKYEMISYLKPFIDECLPHVSQSMDEQRRVWDSFALHFFEHICPKDDAGAYTPRMFAHYMIDDEGRSMMPLYQRHRIFNPYRFVTCNEIAIKPFFENDKAFTGGGLEEDIGARQELVGNPNFLELLNRLYTVNGHPVDGFVAMALPIDKSRPKWIKKCKPGSLRRLVATTMQLKNTHDFLQCSTDRMLELLGEEFSIWMQEHQTTID